MTPDDDVEASGLYFLFGHDRWVTAGSNTDTSAFKTRFETLVTGGSMNGDDLLKQIPAGMRNKFDIEARTQRGLSSSGTILRVSHGTATSPMREPKQGILQPRGGRAGFRMTSIGSFLL
jgi:hypothetical protein